MEQIYQCKALFPNLIIAIQLQQSPLSQPVMEVPVMVENLNVD